MSICNGENERKLKMHGIFLSPRGITLPKIIRPDPNSNSTCVFSWKNLCSKFHLKISMYDLDNEQKLNPEWRNDRIDGRTEWRKGVTLYAPAILWQGIKNTDRQVHVDIGGFGVPGSTGIPTHTDLGKVYFQRSATRVHVYITHTDLGKIYFQRTATRVYICPM